jgi:flagellar hook-associated protein 2
MAALTVFSAGSTSQGVLPGDSTLNTIQNQLASIVATGVKSGGTTNSLSAIGITLQSVGSLAIDSDALSNALQNKRSTVASLFNTTNGIAAQLNNDITN